MGQSEAAGLLLGDGSVPWKTLVLSFLTLLSHPWVVQTLFINFSPLDQSFLFFFCSYETPVW